MRRNRFYQDGTTVALKTYSYPQGTYAPSGTQNVGSAYILPQKSGSMASFNAATLTISPNALIAGGITTTGTASLLIDVNTPAGQLIAFGIGSASFLLSTNSPLLTASLSAVGSASFALTGDGTLSGVGSASGSAALLVSMSATILPTNDASPLRTGTANFAITGSLTPYAIGSMQGSTLNGGTLSEASITAAVWSAVSASYNEAGTMGNKLNSAASGGVDYTALAAAVLAALNATTIPVNMTKVRGQTLSGTGSEIDPWGP